MDFLDLLQKRRACHHFLPNRTIGKGVIEEWVGQAAPGDLGGIVERRSESGRQRPFRPLKVLIDL